MNYKMINIEKDPINKYVKTLRPLSIDFNLYTEGDQDFKKELIYLMIDNIHELQRSILCDAPEAFLSVCHKVKVTIAMLSDNELTDVVNELKALAMVNGKECVVFREKSYCLDRIGTDIVESLQTELN